MLNKDLLIGRLAQVHADPYQAEQLFRSFRNSADMGSNSFKIIDESIDYFMNLKKPKKYSSIFEEQFKKRIDWIIMQLNEA